MFKSRFNVLTGMIVFAALARLIPHPWNLTPLGAMALFGGARFQNKTHAFIVPFAALLISDLIIGLYARMPIVYVSFAIIVGIGLFIRNKKGAMPVVGGVLASAVSFFLITNFGVWAFATYYPHTVEGLIQCYTVAIPYFRNSLIGDAFYSALLFGTFHAFERKFPVLKKASSLPSRS